MIPSMALRTPRRLLHAESRQVQAGPGRSRPIRAVFQWGGTSSAEEGVHGAGPGPCPAAVRRAGRARHRTGRHGLRPRRALAHRGRDRRTRRAARPVHGHRHHGARAGGHHRAAARRRPAGPRRRGRTARPPGRPWPRAPRRRRRGRVRAPLGPARPQPGCLRVHDLLRRPVPAHGTGPTARAVRRRRPVRADSLGGALRPVVLRAPYSSGRWRPSPRRPVHEAWPASRHVRPSRRRPQPASRW